MKYVKFSFYGFILRLEELMKDRVRILFTREKSPIEKLEEAVTPWLSYELGEEDEDENKRSNYRRDRDAARKNGWTGI